MADVNDVVGDLLAEGDYLDKVLGRPDAAFDLPTPSPGWTIAHQIGHLLWTDRVAILACTDQELFAAQRAAFLAAPGPTVEAAAQTEAARPPDQLLEAWRAGRFAVAAALRSVPEQDRLPWLGPPMTAHTLAVARIMETWAHGVDVTDALGQPPAATARLQRVADLGVRTRNFAYRNRDLAPPETHFRVELTGPDGQDWAWGPEDAADCITGPAVDFCLLVTQRRHVADLRLTVAGARAREWVRMAQVFAGPSGAGRAPLPHSPP